MRRIAVLVLAALPACYHVDLAPVSAQMPLQDRMAAYQQLRVAGQNRVITVTTNGQGAMMVNQSDELVLANGDSIVHMDDVLPVVAPDSATARNAQRVLDARHHKYESLAATVGAMIVGGFLLVDGMQTDPQTGLAEPGAESKIGATVMVLGPIVGILGVYYYGYQEGRADRAAMSTYDDGLRAQLQLCVNGLNVVPCEQMAPSAAAR